MCNWALIEIESWYPTQLHHLVQVWSLLAQKEKEDSKLWWPLLPKSMCDVTVGLHFSVTNVIYASSVPTSFLVVSLPSAWKASFECNWQYVTKQMLSSVLNIYDTTLFHVRSVSSIGDLISKAIFSWCHKAKRKPKHCPFKWTAYTSLLLWNRTPLVLNAQVRLPFVYHTVSAYLKRDIVSGV